jgi:hypothetical protein
MSRHKIDFNPNVINNLKMSYVIVISDKTGLEKPPNTSDQYIPADRGLSRLARMNLVLFLTLITRCRMQNRLGFTPKENPCDNTMTRQFMF